eukprot:2258370-Prymnesium_polylepis.1
MRRAEHVALGALRCEASAISPGDEAVELRLRGLALTRADAEVDHHPRRHDESGPACDRPNDDALDDGAALLQDGDHRFDEHCGDRLDPPRPQCLYAVLAYPALDEAAER